MNKDRRKRIDEAAKLLDSCTEAFEQALEIIRDVKDEEEEAYEGMADGFQSGERGQLMQEAISCLENAMNALEGCDLASVVADLESAAQ